jgi:hypothetical protein
MKKAKRFQAKLPRSGNGIKPEWIAPDLKTKGFIDWFFKIVIVNARITMSVGRKTKVFLKTKVYEML